MALAVLDRDDFDVKAVRLHYYALARQKILFRLEGEAVDLAAEPCQRHRHIDGCRVYRLVATCRIEPVLRRLAVFKNGDFYRKIAVPQHPPVVRAFFIFRSRLAFAFGGCFSASATSGQRGNQQQRSERANG